MEPSHPVGSSVHEPISERGSGLIDNDCVKRNVWALSTASLDGSERVQQVLEIVSNSEGAEMLKAFQGHVFQAATCQYANYVLQKAIRQLPVQIIEMVATELRDREVETARDPHGSRIICALCEVQCENLAIDAILLEVARNASGLLRSPCGSAVLAYVLEHRHEKCHALIAKALLGRVAELAMRKNASHVVQAALMYCSPEDQEHIADELLEDDQKFVKIVRDSYFGGFPIETLIFRESSREKAHDLLENNAHDIDQSKTGQKSRKKLTKTYACIKHRS